MQAGLMCLPSCIASDIFVLANAGRECTARDMARLARVCRVASDVVRASWCVDFCYTIRPLQTARQSARTSCC